MRLPRIIANAGLALALAVLLQPTAPGQQEAAKAGEEDTGSTISVDVDIVNILATVRDKKGGLVDDLDKDDFILEEDGVAQTIRYFSKQSDLPLTVGMLVDTSVSQQRVIDVERGAAYKFFQSTLRHSKDLAFLISFDINVELLQDLTDSPLLLHSGLEQLEVQGSAGGVMPSPIPTSGRTPGTVLYDAVFLASDEMLKSQVGRKAIVIISDGNDYGSKLKIEQAIEASHRSDVVIYSVRYFDREFYYRAGAFGTGGFGTLKKLSQETGGTAFEVRKKQPLEEIFEEIQSELRSQYSIGYTSSNAEAGGGFRKINLRAKDKGLKVSAREGYYPKGS